ncbi:NAC domain containing protein [Parasponia andersonii]|uniref:NAC domain containing protein n=1 Tax=Parasponia andersonii TaxID=3476 RepID=A0A2P5D6N5_PARAD|nr:NAC domain containing protein [Parasponia andersonii]
MFIFDTDRKHPFQSNYYGREASKDKWRFHGTKPHVTGEMAATTVSVKLIEGPTMWSLSDSSVLAGMCVIGYKTRFIYYDQDGTKTDWVMDENRVNKNLLPLSIEMENLVLCKIYRSR